MESLADKLKQSFAEPGSTAADDQLEISGEHEIDHDIDFDLTAESIDESIVKARLPKLNPREMKRRQARAEIVGELLKDQQIKNLVKQLLKIANTKGRHIAIGKKLKPNLATFNKIKLK